MYDWIYERGINTLHQMAVYGRDALNLQAFYFSCTTHSNIVRNSVKFPTLPSRSILVYVIECNINDDPVCLSRFLLNLPL